MKQIIYIASPDSQEIHIWKINQDKKFQPIQVLYTSGQVQPIVIHPHKNILYAGVRPYPKIISFRTKNDGQLKKIKEFPIPAKSTHLNINKEGTTLYSVSYQDNSLCVIELDHSGECTSILQVLTELRGCHSSNIEMNQRRLWIPCLKENCIRLYRIGISGKLNENSLQKINTKTNSGPRHMVFHHLYNYAYLINELDSTIDVIKIYASINDLPTIIQTINLIPNNYYHHNNIHRRCWGADIHITPDGRWIYCSDRSNSIISYLKILDNNKMLEFKGCQPTETQPRGFAIDNQGEYLIVAGQKSGFISVYTINKYHGNLTPFFRFPVGNGPMWITITNSK